MPAGSEVARATFVRQWRDDAWSGVHAVSMGEVIAVTGLVQALQGALGQGWVVAVSTTTATGNKIARERLGPLGCPVFWYPLDFAFAVRAYRHALEPQLVVLVEGELWPRMLYECERAAVPVAVVNARVSDRSFRRTLRLRVWWLSDGATRHPMARSG